MEPKKTSTAEQEAGDVYVTILSSDAKKGGGDKTVQHDHVASDERQLQEEFKGWKDKTQALQQESVQLTAQLAAAHLEYRKRIILVMIVVPIAALLFMTEPYYEAYRPAAYTATALLVLTCVGTLIAMVCGKSEELKYITSVWDDWRDSRFTVSTSRVVSAAGKVIGGLRQIATDDKSCESLPVRQLQKQAEVWEAQNEALSAQEERKNLLNQLARLADSKGSMCLPLIMVIMLCGVFFVGIRQPDTTDLKDLSTRRMLLLQVVPALMLLVYFLAFRAVKTECKRLSDESKRLSEKVAKTVAAKSCAEELA